MYILGSSICAGYDFTKEDFGSLAYHRIVEAFKFAYGQRLHLGDPAFNESILEEVRMCYSMEKAFVFHNIPAYSKTKWYT